MVFSTEIFLFNFLPLALAAYYLAPRRGRALMLTGLSYLFYGWANPAFVLLMFASSLIDYVCGRFIAGRPDSSGEIPQLQVGGSRSQVQRIALTISIVSNLSLLGFFKYFNFAVENYNVLVSGLGMEGAQVEQVMRVVLPLGISFYTFQSMSYSIDVYRGEARAIRNFVDFACYVSLFPQLVAGPIVRFQEIAGQLRDRTHTLKKFARGATLFSLGLGKKVLVANPCGRIADTFFDAGTAATLDAWYATAAYTFQIYFDFSGYSDMAIGLGLMLGFVFPRNFNAPYRARSMGEFWQRWHISLSTWLKHYLYFPLGGSRRGPIRTYFNLLMVMLLGGLWHGADLTFVVWGGVHGIWLAGERFLGRFFPHVRVPAVLGIGVTFTFSMLARVFFRAPTIEDALNCFACLFGSGYTHAGARLGGHEVHAPYYLLTFAVAALIVWTAPQAWEYTQRITWRKALTCMSIFALSVALLVTQTYNPFIYFIF